MIRSTNRIMRVESGIGLFPTDRIPIDDFENGKLDS
jgi:hypothetical protein